MTSQDPRLQSGCLRPVTLLPGLQGGRGAEGATWLPVSGPTSHQRAMATSQGEALPTPDQTGCSEGPASGAASGVTGSALWEMGGHNPSLSSLPERDEVREAAVEAAQPPSATSTPAARVRAGDHHLQDQLDVPSLLRALPSPESKVQAAAWSRPLGVPGRSLSPPARGPGSSWTAHLAPPSSSHHCLTSSGHQVQVPAARPWGGGQMLVSPRSLRPRWDLRPQSRPRCQ